MKGLEPTGMSQVFKPKEIPAWSGQHWWVVVVGHHINNPTVFDDDNEENVHLDAESYIGTDGPFCQYCRVTYDKPVLDTPCPGKR